eukprot:gene32324-16896_t
MVTEAELREEIASLSSSVLEIEISRLENSVVHLRRSNAELKEARSEDPDPELKAAIEENIVLIAKQAARIEKLKKEILDAVARPGTEADVATDMDVSNLRESGTGDDGVWL